MYALKTILHPITRFLLTVFGISFCALLMFFLVSIYEGVSEGSVRYVRECDADLWVLQGHATNILRNTSILSKSVGYNLKQIEGVQVVSPITFLLVSVDLPTGPASIYLTGYNEKTGMGGPPSIKEGAEISENYQIVLDAAFAAKNKLKVGDKVAFQGDSLKVVGLSEGTNMFVIQYAFINLITSYKINGTTNFVSCYLLKATPGYDTKQLAIKIKNELKGIAVFDKETFLENNIREMNSGILSLLFAVAFIGGIVLAVILSLILSVSVLEQRKDYAIMKAIGSPKNFITGLVVTQSLLLATCGIIVAISLFFPLLSLLQQIAPEITGKATIGQISMISFCVLIISLISSFIPVQKVRNIYPLEVFS